jgi:hypothetical protein
MTAPEKDDKGRFLTGNSGGGRHKGSRNKLAEDFITDLHEAWKANGKEVIAAVLADKPVDFLKVIAGVIPKEVKIDRTAVDDLGDDEIAAYLAIARTAFEAHRAVGEGAEQAGVGEQAESLRTVQ